MIAGEVTTMALSTLAPETVTPEEHARYVRVIALLAEPGVKRTNAEGETVVIAEILRPMMQRLADLLAADKVTFLNGISKSLTIHQAADILNIPYAHVIALLDNGTISSTMVYNQRRIRNDAVMADYPVWKAEQKRLLKELTPLNEEMRFYDLPPRVTDTHASE